MIEPIKSWHTLTRQAAFEQLDSASQGLTSAEAARRLAEIGPNEIQAAKRISALEILLAQFKNILILILLTATLISAFAGHAIEATAIIVIVCFAVLFGFIQDYRAERAIESLRLMAAPLATVIRDGSTSILPARDLVPGDIILLHAGNRIPGDARLLEAIHLQTQEAPLTGESEPVEKNCNPIPGTDLPPAEWKNMVFAGTMLVQGGGVSEVSTTGLNTELGKIGKAMAKEKPDSTPLGRQTSRTKPRWWPSRAATAWWPSPGPISGR